MARQKHYQRSPHKRRDPISTGAASVAFLKYVLKPIFDCSLGVNTPFRRPGIVKGVGSTKRRSV